MAVELGKCERKYTLFAAITITAHYHHRFEHSQRTWLFLFCYHHPILINFLFLPSSFVLFASSLTSFGKVKSAQQAPGTSCQKILNMYVSPHNVPQNKLKRDPKRSWNFWEASSVSVRLPSFFPFSHFHSQWQWRWILDTRRSNQLSFYHIIIMIT